MAVNEQDSLRAPARMTPILEAYISERQVSGWLLERIKGAGSAEAAVFEELAGTLRPSANTLRDWIRLADDICARDAIDYTALFEDSAVRACLTDGKGSLRDRQARLKQALGRIRYPETARIQGEIERVTRALTARYGLSPVVAEDMEGDSVTITVRFKEPGGLKEQAKRLDALAGDPEFAELLALVKGRL